ncbi:SusC/RagA family TonB-linked outer membrane protein [Flavivirga eckloniae]|uniref:SusC/RagA family TonB-linked outer membrane protein n=1 Tax=Flavivirga eckloniae TaxID=1803846 RepID=A0A2K9PP48_9FLAO|nr:SusC/RagA family TonB-linked outer membrane protein [Flavivirga eckloniae]AUP78829.1 hypothetical protein C1H87_08995 [Flavivirga eckloniae]
MKKTNTDGSDLLSLPKFDLKMKLFIVFLTATLFQLQANSYGQKTKVSLDMDQTTLGAVFDKIEDKTEFRFLYSSWEIDLNRTISIKVKKKQINMILNLLFADTNISYRVLDRQIVLTKGDYVSRVNLENKINPRPQQGITITGRVTDKNNNPLIGANILVKGTTRGAQTGFDGSYSINVSDKKAILVVSYLGFTPKEVPVNDLTTIDVQLEESTDELSEIIVTALGIKKERKAVGYAIDQIGAEELNATGEPSVLLNLAAKAPGVQVFGSSNGVDGTPRVIIRGVTSLSSDNQPLYVLDGLPLLSNRSLSESIFSPTIGYNDLGNPLSDINPNDIESVSILKGASATALYGARGANGVIMITTKKGKSGQKGWEVTMSSGITFQSALTLPERQLRYGQGLNGEFSYIDGNGAGVNESEVRLWGPEYNGQQISQWDPITGGAVVKPWLPYGANNYKNFYETGYTAQHNLSLTHVTESSNARLSIGHQDIKGIVPNTGLKRITGSINSTFQLGEKLTLNFVGTGSKMTSNNRASFGGTSGGDGGLWQIMSIPTNIDIRDLRDYKDEFGNRKSFSERGGNPYWNLYENLKPVIRNRFSVNIGLTYAITDWLSLQGNLFQDRNVTEHSRIEAKHLYSDGYYSEGINLNKEVNLDARLTIDKDIFKDLNLNFMTGIAVRDEDSNNKFSRTEGGLLVRGVYNLGNSASPVVTRNSITEKKVNSLFSSVELNYKNYAFLTVTGRNDWSSTLPRDEWSFFYPSVAGSLIFTDAFGIKNHVLSYGKLRANWAKVGDDTRPYALNRFVKREAVPFNGSPVLGLENVIPATGLIPEETTSFELGTELYFFDSKVRLDVAYYERESSNQLIQVASAWERGARNSFINAGTISNKGIELSLNVNPISTNNFNWDVNINWAKNKGTVTGFPEDLVTSKIIGAWLGAEILAENGSPYGIIKGFKYFRDSEEGYNTIARQADNFATFGYTLEDNITGTGKILTRNGIPMTNQWQSAGTSTLGIIAPSDWTGGINNTFTYKNVQLSFLVDVRSGGHVLSTTEQYMGRYGHNHESVDLNANGVPVRNPIADGGGYIFDGIDVETGKPNTIAITPQDMFSGWNIPTEATAWDATNIKLRELSVSYNASKKILGKLGIANARLSLVGRNLWLIKNGLNGIDTETASMGSLNNGVGMEYGAVPNSKSYGMNLSVSF